MYVVGEDARFYHYRNFTGYVFVPANTPDMLDVDDTGVSNTDGTTSTLRPRFTGTAPQGSYVRLYVAGIFVGEENPADGVTAYSIQSTVDLAQGPHSVTIRLREDTASPATNRSGDLTNPSVTAKTPENVTRITATVDIDVTFSEPMMGLDATDLALSGTAAGFQTVDPPLNTSGDT